MVLAIFNCYSIPIGVALNPVSMRTHAFLALNWVIDFFFMIDIFVNFRTIVVNTETGDEIMVPKNIAKAYLRGRFWIDLLATVPLDWIAVQIFSASDSSELQLFGILKLVRVLRLGKIIQYLNSKEDVKVSLKLLKLIFFLVLYIHCLGCAWWMLAN
jgi:hyperpolarization activated cyclic nucleotide-gated potassium channel 2